MHRPHPGEAPDYTNAVLAMALVNLLWMLVAIWVVLGFPVMVFIGWVLSRVIDRIGDRRDASG